MEYTNYGKYNNEPVDGFVLQAPVSDRESLDIIWPDPEETLELAARYIAEGRADDCLPNEFVPGVIGGPISAYRLHSLCVKGSVSRSLSRPWHIN